MNADGTVDFLACDSELDEIRVDYRQQAELETYTYEPVIEWHAVRSATMVNGVAVVGNHTDVAYYGELPRGWSESFPAVVAPDDWTEVSTGIGFAYRDDLTEGSWVWFTHDENWAWIPDHPCDGWELGPDGEPRHS